MRRYAGWAEGKSSRFAVINSPARSWSRVWGRLCPSCRGREDARNRRVSSCWRRRSAENGQRKNPMRRCNALTCRAGSMCACGTGTRRRRDPICGSSARPLRPPEPGKMWREGRPSLAALSRGGFCRGCIQSAAGGDLGVESRR